MYLLLPLLFSLLLSSGASGSNDAVLDTNGDVLQRGQLYNVKSVLSKGGAGGLKLAASNEPCPLYVTKAPFHDELGQMLAFFPENRNDQTVREGRTLYIKFAEKTPCPESTMWRLDRMHKYVTTGGTMSSAVGPHFSRFSIDKAAMGYEIRACPCSMGVERPSCRMGCMGTLGVVGGEVDRALGINNDSPHRVVFERVKRGRLESVIRTNV